MIKLRIPTFTIKPASKRGRLSKRESKPTGSNISRKCYAVVKEIDGEFKAVINIDKQYIRLKKGDELSNEQLILPFTERSLDLKGKIYIFLKEKDKYGHYICIIRNTINAELHPGLPIQYNAVHENLLLAGHIIRKNGKMYFEYEDLVAHHYLAESHICDVKVDNNKPLFNK